VLAAAAAAYAALLFAGVAAVIAAVTRVAQRAPVAVGGKSPLMTLHENEAEAEGVRLLGTYASPSPPDPAAGPRAGAPALAAAEDNAEATADIALVEAAADVAPAGASTVAMILAAERQTIRQRAELSRKRDLVVRCRPIAPYFKSLQRTPRLTRVQVDQLQ
jgi:hypothetical protein